MIGKALLAVQHAGEIDVQLGEEFEWTFSIHHLEAEQIGRRYRPRRIARGARGHLIAVERVLLAERIEEDNAGVRVRRAR